MKNSKILLKVVSIIIIALCIVNLSSQIQTKAEILSSSQKTEEELKNILRELNEESIIFENGISLYSSEILDLSSKVDEFNITEIRSNNEEIITVEDNSVIAMNEGVTFLLIKVNDKYHVVQVYVESGIESISILDESRAASRDHYLVFVDAGHGGTDPGAVANGVKEKDINLSIALKIRNKLRSLGVEVVMNRETDVFVDYRDTATMANNSKADVFVSIHQNSASATSANGIETFYHKDIDKLYGQTLHKSVIKSTGAYDRTLKWNEFTVTVKTTMPAVLMECGFLTNATEVAKLKTDSYQEKIADGIVNGIMEYLEKNVEINNIASERIFGDTRYETSYKIFESGWSNSDSAILVSGLDYPDALCAAPLATKYNAPILLTRNTSLANQNELKNLLISKGVKNVIIIGGQGVIPIEVEKELDSLGISNKRLGGSTRFETSVLIANEVGIKNGEVILTSGRGFADGISISAVAAAKGMPILISEASSLPQVVRNYMNNNSISKTYVIGGSGVLTESLASTLKNPERLGGKDRYETNRSIFDRFKNELNLSEVYLAAGTEFPDALSASAIAAKKKSFVILSDTKTVKQSCIDIISSSRQYINKVNILGSNKVILDSVIRELGIKA